MPIYDYACAACEERFDALVSFDAAPPQCPSCGTGDTERQLSTFATSASSSQRSSARARTLVPAARAAGGHTHSGGCCGGGGCD